MKKKTCRIGVVGAGRIGRLHAENILFHLPQFELVVIADPQIDKNWAEKLGIAIVSTQSEDVLCHPDLDAVLIASPSHLHLEQIITASLHGKAIFCEKPIGLNEEEIEKTLNIIKKNNTLLQLGFNRRFDPGFANIQKRVRFGEIGTPHILRITSRDPACPSKEYCATSGGIFMDMSIHDFDMARFLMQSEVVEVYATGAVLINPDFEQFDDVDTAIIQLRFANGAFGVIDNSRQAIYGYDQRVEVFGSGGMLLAENQLEHTVSRYSANATDSAKPQYFFLERYHQAYLAELNAFYSAWNDNQTSPVSGLDGLQALRIAKAAKQSLETHLPVVLN
ncbi:inositol 2-dehydrogenase [Legionella pneumophila]|uniref:Myo-inositol 2-dehydrogenase n=1 Tax=Legionella pneumophila subsp. pascullei TaxID=91890 RepID=A0AAX2IVK8_LEGPN|nr:inositol 2-dehydrogenase [Legionella pneumophila]AMP89697.1 inositol 2-dehydrogenase [Legionella pneumophila subsp. pascullei]AMP92637.1 inositol 2-dehydrogenase [Legionella pneumophila subsp. pascullei]AMP95602.1 inositol 2-dehydrogenase [Legionella pneumophila subsp. pascullei]SQG90512.1 myo-inositol 2-dehydrogenase [Legionella pneumophila subsp. pascullei]VEH06858.1 myo-inositol 2-dehydrogenase [Legionella pneumophila subsp. pascullei]